MLTNTSTNFVQFMKSVVIVHGWDGRPDEAMLQWIRGEFEKKGYEAIMPTMPHPETPTIEDWVTKLQETVPKEGELILVGHSIGCQAVLRHIETLDEDRKIDKVILIAPWMHLDQNTIEEEGEEVMEVAKPWMETPINFSKIKGIVGGITAIFSDNDPYVPLSNVDMFEKELGANIVIERNKGHFTESDDVTDLPAIKDLI